MGMEGTPHKATPPLGAYFLGGVGIGGVTLNSHDNIRP